MEYTNDIILNVRYKKDEMISSRKNNLLKKMIKKIKSDEYFVLVMLISTIVLFIDFILLKQFIDVFKLL